MVIEGPINPDIFEDYIQNILCPTRHSGDIVLMDNVSCHKDHESKR